MNEKESKVDQGKREILKKSMYVVPAVLTLAAAPSFASAGSSKSVSVAGAHKGKALGHSTGHGGGGSGRPAAVAEKLEQREEDDDGTGRKGGPPDGSPPVLAKKIASK